MCQYKKEVGLKKAGLRKNRLLPESEKETLLKLLVTADLHYNLKQYDWVLNQAHSYDAIIMAGDLLDLGSNLGHDVQSIVVERYLTKMKAGRRILVSSGNHDVETVISSAGVGVEPAAPWIQHLRYDGLDVDGMCVGLDARIKISICPWWESERQRLEIHEKLLQDQKSSGDFWIWIHHAPPDHTPLSWTGKDFKGEAMLNTWINEFQPDLVFCGHIHNAPFKQGGSWNMKQGKTWVFNAGREMGSVPSHLVVDLEAGTVEWHSSAGPELCDLKA